MLRHGAAYQLSMAETMDSTDAAQRERLTGICAASIKLVYILSVYRGHSLS